MVQSRYMRWESMDSPYNDEAPDFQCESCKEKEQVMDDLRDFLENIQDMLYSEDHLDTALLEEHMDSMAHLLEMRLKPRVGAPNVARPVHIRPRILMDWQTYNNQINQGLLK